MPQQPPKPPHVQPPAPWPRAPRPATHVGDRNEDNSARLVPPSGVGLTQPPPFDLAAPHEVEDLATGVVFGDDLKKARRRRSPSERTEHLEDRVDDLEAMIQNGRVETATQFGQVNTALGRLVGAIEGLKTVVSTMVQRGQVDYAAHAEITKTKEITQITVDGAQQVDKIDERKTSRKMKAAFVAGGAALVEIIHRIVG